MNPEPGKGQLGLPEEVSAVLRRFRTCEFSTLAKDGTPITWPMVTLWDPDRGSFLLTTNIGLPKKAFNARRDPRVSLLFSDSTGSGLPRPPAVLVQGDATVADRITSTEGLEEYWKILFRRQPISRIYSWPVVRWFMDYYYFRLKIEVRTRRVLYWIDGDFSKSPRVARPAE